MFRFVARFVAVAVVVAVGGAARADTAAVSGAVRQPPPPLRVFMAPLKVGAGADKDVVALFEERLLVAARRHDGFAVVAGSDVAAVVDVEAARQASGCAGEMSCAAEIAGALDAPQLVTGQLGRVGDTWVLALTRTERASLTVLARVARETHGATPEGLLPLIDGAVDELFGVAGVAGDGGGVSAVVVGGGVGVGVGVAALVVGTVAAGLSWQAFGEAKEAVDDPLLSDPLKQKAIDDGAEKAAGTNAVALGGWIGGGALVVVGGAVLALGLVGGGE